MYAYNINAYHLVVNLNLIINFLTLKDTANNLNELIFLNYPILAN